MSATPEEEAENDRKVGERAQAWRDLAEMLGEFVKSGAPLGPVSRQVLMQLLRDAEPPGTAAFEIRRGYRAKEAEFSTPPPGELELGPARLIMPGEEAESVWVALDEAVKTLRKTNSRQTYVGSFKGCAIYVHRGSAS